MRGLARVGTGPAAVGRRLTASPRKDSVPGPAGGGQTRWSGGVLVGPASSWSVRAWTVVTGIWQAKSRQT
jgi:hypothetical protein